MLTRRALLQSLAAGTAVAASRRPNFVIIFADDLGWGDLGCFGSPNIRTPRIDAMAREGTRLTNFYAQPICGPSRSALMTGCYPMRLAEENNKKHLHPVLHSKELTLAEVLKPAGYATAMIGKWDLGGHSNTAYRPGLLPAHQGFDMHFGTPSSNDSVTETVLMRDGKVVEKPAEQTTLTERYTDEAIRFIREKRHQPFFLYLCPNMPHTALAASAKFKGKSPRGLFGDVVEELDFNVGRILDALRQQGLDRNTYVLFTSDNGPWLIKRQEGGSSGPFRSGKVSTWEGGVRVPCIFWAPGRIPAGRVIPEMAATLDVMPTFARLAGQTPPSDRVIDGLDIGPLLHGAASAQSPRDTYYYYLWTHLQAVRRGKWKLHVPRPGQPQWIMPLLRSPHIEARDAQDIAQPMLFDLDADPGERYDVAAANPEVVRDMLELVERVRTDLGDYNRTGKNVRFFDPMEAPP
ncbi:MAG: sulfatase, partial [Acidobacteria bacterium]|nr:sulfatase [Acidobacteriota bacterium]